jgi:NodT family efflux transporter outer membrane factor (OMF) lipoprotein
MQRCSMTSQARTVGQLAACAMLTACAVGPNYRAPGPVPSAPATYAAAVTEQLPVAASTAAPLDLWWRALADPMLDSLVAKALGDNPDLATAEAHVRQSRALARVAGAAFLPSLEATGRVGRDQLSRNGENLALIPFRPATTEFSDYRVGFDASWEIDLAGRTRREVEAALARLGSSTESRNAARVVVAAEVADSYVAYRAAVERLALARRNAASLSAALALQRLAAAAGIASDSELHRAEAEAAAAEAMAPGFAAEARAALLRLAALCNEPAATLEAQLAEPRPVPVPPASVPTGLPSELLRRRPDVRRAERELAAATADVGSAIAAQFPRISLVGDFGWDSIHSGSLTAAASRYWNIGPQVAIPILAGGRLHAQADAARAARDAALETYRATVLNAFADAESALVRYASELRRTASLDTAVRALDADVALERQRLAAGDVSRLELLATERALDQAVDQRVSSAVAAALDFIALQKALGGGWQQP